MEEKKYKIKRSRYRRKKSQVKPISKIEEVTVQVNKSKELTESERAAEKKRVQERNKKYELTRVRKTIAFKLDEWTKIETQLEAAKIDFTEFAKHKLLKTKIKFPSNLKNEAMKISLYQKVYSELNTQRDILNQVTQKINPNDPLKIQLLQQIEAIKKQFAEIQRALNEK